MIVVLGHLIGHPYRNCDNSFITRGIDLTNRLQAQPPIFHYLAVNWGLLFDEEVNAVFDPLTHVVLLSQLDAFQPALRDNVFFDGCAGHALDL